jgi:hypothetical protein
MMTWLGAAAPRVLDKYMERAMFTQQKDFEGRNRTMDSLYAPKRDGRETGPYDGYVMQSSAYTRAVTSGAFRTVAWLAAAVVLAAGARRAGAFESRPAAM